MSALDSVCPDAFVLGCSIPSNALQHTKCVIDLLAKRPLVELVQARRLMEPFANAVGLRMFGLGSCVLNVVEPEEKLIRMPVLTAAILRATVCEHSQHARIRSA